jgi:hypothetical protein
MENQHTPDPRDEREQYEAPTGVELGTFAELTQSVTKGGQNPDGYGGFPSR